MSNSQLTKLKVGKKSCTQATLNPSSNVVSNSDDEINFPHKFLLTDT